MIKLNFAKYIDGVGGGEALVDPHEALKALEEQAPEVLREYCAEVLADICGLTVEETTEVIEYERGGE